MAQLDEVVDRLDRLESKDAIRGLVTAYAIACDEHDLPRLADLFTEDAIFSSSSGTMTANGRAAIASMFIEMLKVRGPAFHWTHDVSVEIDPESPDRATGLVYSHAETTPNGVVSLAAMKYRDAYRREGGRWRISKREISFLYYVPFAEYGDGLSSRNRLFVGGERLPADYPESLAHWQDFHRKHVVQA
ncbi:MAG: nuclear transport factor 2 family protein [Sphingomonadales bacterium]